MYSVNLYHSVKDKKGTLTDLSSILETIKGNNYKEQIETLRSLYNTDKKEYDKRKGLLNAFTVSGSFSERKVTGLINHTGLICLDIDKIHNPTDIKKAVCVDSFVKSAFISPSGSGVKIIVCIDPLQHEKAFNSLCTYYETNFGLIIDQACKDVSRLCFVSYDESLYINKEATVYKTPEKQTEQTKTKDNILFDVQTITERIEAQNKDITGVYGDWLKLGFSLADGLGESGREYFKRISVFSNSYNEAEADKQFNECLKARKRGNTINSFFYLCKSNGIDTVVKNGSYNNTRSNTKEKTVTAAVLPLNNNNSSVKFWNVLQRVNSDGTKQFKGIEVDKLNFLNLLFDFGFRRFDINGGFSFVQVENNIVQETPTQKIQDKFFEYLKGIPNEIDKRFTREDIHRKVLNNLETLFGKTLLSTLRNDRDFEFNTDNKNESFVYYRNGFVKCIAGDYFLHPYTELQKAIWKERIINRDFYKLPIGSGGNFDKFIFNVSGKDKDRYTSLMSIIGYLLHDFTEGKMKAVILTDSKISDDNEGRTGKTLFGKALKHIRKVCEISGKDFKPDNKFKYQDCQLSSQILFLNDAKQYFNLETLYTDITEGITIEKKNQTPILLKLKYLITTNKTIKTKGASSKDRVIEFEFSDHYSDLYTPEMEFKQWFFGESDWNAKEWELFDNFMMCCISLYLEHGILEVNPVNLLKRKFIDQTCKQFYEFVLSGEIKPNTEFNLSELLDRFENKYPDFEFKTPKPTTRLGKWIRLLPDYLNDFSGLSFKECKKVTGNRFYIIS